VKANGYGKGGKSNWGGNQSGGKGSVGGDKRTESQEEKILLPIGGQERLRSEIMARKGERAKRNSW